MTSRWVVALAGVPCRSATPKRLSLWLRIFDWHIFVCFLRACHDPRSPAMLLVLHLPPVGRVCRCVFSLAVLVCRNQRDCGGALRGRPCSKDVQRL